MEWNGLFSAIVRKKCVACFFSLDALAIDFEVLSWLKTMVKDRKGGIPCFKNDVLRCEVDKGWSCDGQCSLST